MATSMIAGTALLLCPAPCFAGEATQATRSAPAKPAKSSPEEVVVTASRNGSAKVQNIPIAVSVLKPEAVEQYGGSGLLDYTQTVPSVSVEDFGPGVNKITIRGVVTSGLDYTNVQDRPTVAVYLDETPISLQSQNPDLKVFDLSRVEVLRGPEGTLYGAGAMAGTIRLITQKPDTQDYFGSLESVLSDTDGGYGGFNYSLRAMGNFPIVNDKVALRVVLYRGDDSGFIKNIGIGKNNQDDISNQARVALRIKPNQDFTIDASLTYEGLDAGVYDGLSGLKPYTMSSLEPESTKDNMVIYNLTGTYDFDGFSATNSFSFLDRRNANYAQDDYLANALVYPPNDLVPSLDVIRNKTSDVVDEFRIYSTDHARLSWNAGVFYEKFTRDYFQDTPTRNFDSYYSGLIDYPGYSSTDDGAFHADDVFSGTQDVNEQQVAVFGQATYRILENLNLTAGLRYFDWHQNFNLYFGGVFGASPGSYGGVNGVPLAETGKAGATGTTPRFALDYHVTPDSMLFAEAAKGFRYGGVNQPVPISTCGADLAAIGLKSAPIQFGPDKLWSYSLGEKSTFLGNRLTFDVTAFYIDWNDVQTEKNLACAYYFIENKGHVESKGVELESVAKLTPQLSLSTNASFTDSVAQGEILDQPGGSSAPYTPKFVASLAANYTVPLDDAKLEFGLQYNYRSSEKNNFSAFDYSQSSPSTLVPDPTFRNIPDMHTLNAEITYHVKGWQVGLFANNIGSFAKIVNVVAPPDGSVVQPGDLLYYARPMTIGVRVKTTF